MKKGRENLSLSFSSETLPRSLPVESFLRGGWQRVNTAGPGVDSLRGRRVETRLGFTGPLKDREPRTT